MTETTGSRRTPGLGPILLTVVLDLLGFGLVIPLITFYSETFGATERQALALMGMYSLAQFLFAPVWGALSDRYGRRPIMLMSIAATAMSLALFAMADQLWLLFVARFLHGAFAANISTAQAYVADVTTKEDRARGMGLIGASFGLGFTLGPWVGGELSTWGLTAPIWLACSLSTINFVWAVFGLPESTSARTRHPRRMSPVAIFKGVAHPVVGLAIGLTFAATLAFAMMEFAFPLVAEHEWAINQRGVGRIFGIIGVVGIVVQGGLIRHLVKRFGESRLITGGYLLTMIGMLGLTVASPGATLMCACFAMALGVSVSGPSLQALISRGASEDEQGAVLGINQGMSAMARAVSPWLALAIYAPTHRVAPFLASALVLAAALGLSLPATRRAAPASA